MLRPSAAGSRSAATALSLTTSADSQEFGLKTLWGAANWWLLPLYNINKLPPVLRTSKRNVKWVREKKNRGAYLCFFIGG